MASRSGCWVYVSLSALLQPGLVFRRNLGTMQMEGYAGAAAQHGVMDR